MDIVLTLLEGHTLYAKLSKYEFGMAEILYLVYAIGQEGVKVHMENILSILDWPSPKTLTELRGFIGLCAYYQKFVNGFSKLSSTLTDLTKKGAFSSSEEAEKYSKK